MDDYISVCDLKNNYTEQENSIKIYQVQSEENSKTATISHVGFIKIPCDVLIKEFDILEKFHCCIISKIYSENDFINFIDKFLFIKIAIYHNKILIANLCYNFNTIPVIQNVMNYISTTNKKYILNGFFTITMHFIENDKFKYIEIEKSENFIGTNEIIQKMINLLFDDKIQEILALILLS